MLPFEGSEKGSSKKAVFRRFFEENRRRKILLAKEWQRLGANVLLVRAELLGKESPLSFEFRETEGISQLFVKIPKPKKTSFLRFREVFGFCSAISENAPSLGGIFKPDIVVSGGVIPSSVFAGIKICESCGCALATELFCLPTEFFKKNLRSFFLNPVLIFIKRNVEAAFSRSEAVLSFFPKAAVSFPKSRNLYPMLFPAQISFEEPSENADSLRETLFSFREGGTFVLAFCGELEEGFSIEELMLAAANFGQKFALVFLSEGTRKNYYKRFVSEKGITNVFFLEGVLKKDIPYVLTAADGIFVSESDFSKGFFPEEQNFWNALGAQKPVIASSEHWADFFRKAGGVIITKPRRRDSISLGIKTLLSMTETDRETLGRSNRDFFEKNSLQNFAKDSFFLFDNLAKQKEI